MPGAEEEEGDAQKECEICGCVAEHAVQPTSALLPELLTPLCVSVGQKIY